MAYSARWLLGGRRHAVVEVEVPSGPLGILLDGDDLDRPVLEAFAQVAPSDPQQRGAVELSGRVPLGSVLVAVNEYDFMESNLGFHEVGEVLRDTGHLPRTLKFHVPLSVETEESRSNVPPSQQFAPRRGPPPREEDETEDEVEEEEEEEEESDDDVRLTLKAMTTAQPQPSNSNLPLSQQFAPRRGPPPREEEEEESDEEEVEGGGGRTKGGDNAVFESGSSSDGDSFQEIQMAEVAVGEEVILASTVRVAEDQVSDGSTSWTLTGSNLGESSNTPMTSSASSASPEKQIPLDGPLQFSPKSTHQSSPGQSKLSIPARPKSLSIEIDDASPSLPTELSFGTMAALAETRHFDSDDSSDDSTEEESEEGSNQASSRGVNWKAESARKPSSFLPEQPENQSPEKLHQPSPVPLLMASNVSSGTIVTSLMAQTNQSDRDDSVEEEDEADYVTAVAPPGPLGLNLDGGVLNRAVVMGFVKLRDGSKGALERTGDIVAGSVVVRINGEDFSRASLNEVRKKLGELSQQPRTLVFRLPARVQQSSTRLSPAMRRAPTLPSFEEDFDKRRKFELALVMRYDKSVLARRECWFCIDAKWMARWVDFVARGGPEPGPITNETLLHLNWRKMLAHDAPGRPDTARDGLVLMKDYRVVSPMVWCLFAELHGPGEAPLLARYLMDIHAEALSDREVGSILEVPGPKATALANDLRDKCFVRPSTDR